MRKITFLMPTIIEHATFLNAYVYNEIHRRLCMTKILSVIFLYDIGDKMCG